MVSKDFSFSFGKENITRSSPADFRKPKSLPRNQENAFTPLFQDYAHRIATQFSNLWGEEAQVTIESVSQCPFSHFLLSIPTPSFFCDFEIYPFESQGMIEISSPLVYSTINRMLGNEHKTSWVGRALNELETGLTRKLFNMLLHELHFTWEPIATATFGIRDLQSNQNPSFSISKQEICVVTFLRVELKNLSAMISLCLPVNHLTPFLKDLEKYQHTQIADSMPLSSPQPKHIATLQALEVSLVAVLGKLELTLADFQKLEIGDVLDLGQSAYRPINIRVENENIFKAIPGLSGRHRGILLQKMITKE